MNLDTLWQAVAANPADAEAKRRLAEALGDTHAGIGLTWCASHGKHPRRLSGGYGWCEATPAREHDPESIHYSLCGYLCRMNQDYCSTYEELSEAFYALGAALKELREVVQ